MGAGAPGSAPWHTWTDPEPLKDIQHVGLSAWDRHVAYKDIKMHAALPLSASHVVEVSGRFFFLNVHLPKCSTCSQFGKWWFEENAPHHHQWQEGPVKKGLASSQFGRRVISRSTRHHHSFGRRVVLFIITVWQEGRLK